MKYYKLLKPLPGLKPGAIFAHYPHKYDGKEWGGVASGALVLAWMKGNCQQDWCGETYVFPGQLIDYPSWFELTKEDKCPCCGK